MKIFKKSNARIFLFFILGALVLQSCDTDPVDPTSTPVLAPVANFTASATTITAGESITFNDISTGSVVSRQWEISAGSPGSSTASSVVSQFLFEGKFNIQLTVTNASGSTTKALVVTVKPMMFIHTAGSNNTVGATTYFDNPVTNGQSNAVLIVTPLLKSTGVYVDKSLSVIYSNGKWGVFNQSGNNMAVGSQFCVLVKTNTDKAFSIVATASGSLGVLNHPSLNNNPNARFLITQHYLSSASFVNNYPIGIYYSGGNWIVFNQSGYNMPTNARFNVVIDDKIFVATASTPNGPNGSFSNTLLDNQPESIVVATQYWTQVNNPNEIGVYYSYITNQWTVFNENLKPMPANAKFMVLSNRHL
jgi:PKD repeat protein